KVRVGYNEDDQFLVGASAYMKTFDFRKEPFSSQQTLGTLISPARDAYQFNYSGEFIHVVSRTDLVLNGEVVKPHIDNFFGFGNETERTHDIDFYKVRYSDAAGTA